MRDALPIGREVAAAMLQYNIRDGASMSTGSRMSPSRAVKMDVRCVFHATV